MMEIQPLTDVQKLKTWTKDSVAPWCLPTVPLKKTDRGRPRTLVCHDLKGGYLEDRWTQGGPGSEAYRFVHWALVDSFVYFSHNFVTIPPPCWVDAAHLHDVPILGTVITEWEDGAKMCHQILENEESIGNFVDQLVDVARCHGFDGWLLNIENALEGLASRMECVLKLLTDRIHCAIPGSSVIWYDSVTSDGKLDWQNELNASNRGFFDACDGIFLNYAWDVEKLERSASLAAERALDVYVGVDVFGRGCFGGGGFNSSRALNAIRSKGLSAAIFAQAWTWETFPARDDFVDNDYRFWGYLLKFCGHNTSGPKALPFSTSFCQGSGRRVYRRGISISEGPWYNLSLQEAQTRLSPEWSREGLRYSVRPYLDDGYNGGGSLRIRGSEGLEKLPDLPLWKCNWETEGRQRAIVSFTWKASKPGEDVGLALVMRVVPGTLVLTDGTDAADPSSRVLRPVDEGTLRRLTRRGLHLPQHRDNGWRAKCFVLPPATKISEVTLRVLSEAGSGQGFDILLGQFQVALLSALRPRRRGNVVGVKFEKETCSLRWDLGDDGDEDRVYDVYKGREYLGSTRRRCFYVNSNVDGDVTFTVREKAIWYAQPAEVSCSVSFNAETEKAVT